MIIADSATNPRGFPYPLLNMQALINSCVNINIPDSLCGLLLPNVNLINICEPKVNLWAFKGVSCKLGGCCLLTAPLSAGQPGMVALTALLGSGMANGYCQICTNLVTSQIMPSENGSQFSFKISRYNYGLPPPCEGYVGCSQGHRAHVHFSVDAKADEDKLPVFLAK